MDLSRAELLLERYWNCVTTVEEEEELRKYFNENEVPQELAESAKLFKYFELQRQSTLDKKFDAEVIDKIQEHKSPVVVKMGHSFQNYMRVAAAVLVVAVASLVFRMEYFEDEKPKMLLVEDTFQTPEEAYEETKKAFLLIAEKMNSGRIQAQKIGVLNEAENKIKTGEE